MRCAKPSILRWLFSKHSAALLPGQSNKNCRRLTLPRGDRIDDQALGQLLGDYEGSGRSSDGGRSSHSSSEDGGGADGEQRALLVKGKPVSEDQLKSILQVCCC